MMIIVIVDLSPVLGVVRTTCLPNVTEIRDWLRPYGSYGPKRQKKKTKFIVDLGIGFLWTFMEESRLVHNNQRPRSIISLFTSTIKTSLGSWCMLVRAPVGVVVLIMWEKRDETLFVILLRHMTL